MNKSKLGGILSMAVMILAGLVLLFKPGEALETAGRIIGIALLVYGIISIVGYLVLKSGNEQSAGELIWGIVAAVAGIIIMIGPKFLIDIFPMVMGVLIAASGVRNLIRAISVKRAGGSGWGTLILLSIITVLLGVLVFFNPFKTMTVLVRIIGAILLYNGIVGLIAAIKS